jgi:hypothetical protein
MIATDAAAGEGKANPRKIARAAQQATLHILAVLVFY